MFLAIELQGEQWSRTDLAAIVRELNRRFKEKFAKERLKHQRVAKDSLHELPDCYKIKITTPQFRLIYHVNDTKR